MTSAEAKKFIEKGIIIGMMLASSSTNIDVNIIRKSVSDTIIFPTLALEDSSLQFEFIDFYIPPTDNTPPDASETMILPTFALDDTVTVTLT